MTRWAAMPRWSDAARPPGVPPCQSRPPPSAASYDDYAGILSASTPIGSVPFCVGSSLFFSIFLLDLDSNFVDPLERS
jgi:hypothetical protein